MHGSCGLSRLTYVLIASAFMDVSKLLPKKIHHTLHVQAQVIDGFFGIWSMKKQYFPALQLNPVEITFAHSSTNSAYGFLVNKL